MNEIMLHLGLLAMSLSILRNMLSIIVINDLFECVFE